MSFCVMAIVAAMIAVKAPMTAMNAMIPSAASTSGDKRASRYSPLVTIVAA